MTLRLFTDEETGETVLMRRQFTPLLPDLAVWVEIDRTSAAKMIQPLVDLVISGLTAEQMRQQMLTETQEEE
jgi:hypothetical protein